MRIEDMLPGWRSDAFLHRFDAELIERDDALVVRTSACPDFYWGNFLLLPRAPRDEDLAHWLERFATEVAVGQPACAHVAIGINAAPAGEALPCWRSAGFEVDSLVLLQLGRGELRVAERPVNDEVLVRPVDLETEMDEVITLQCADIDGFEPQGYERHRRRQMMRLAAMERAGKARWFGLWQGRSLVAGCGLTWEGDIARFQHVETHPAWRRRGLCTRLIEAVSRHAFEQLGVSRLWMGADPDDVAIGIYRGLGYQPISSQWSLQRRAAVDRVAPGLPA
jgi:RimJ/RimL family protein N-acetyltransferase